ncbi:MAG: VCBS repeat-containing protein, partial [Planctomycetota bacterium]
MRSPVTYIVSVVLALVLSGCSEEAAPRRLTGNPDARYDPTPSTAGNVAAGVAYTDVTNSAGIDIEHVSGAYGKKLLPETMGGGVGVFDYDNDGKLDLLFVQGRYWDGHVPAGASQPTLKLYRNLGNWKFQDVTEAAGLAISVYGMGCAIADYDADGDMDIYVTCLGKNRLFRNRDGKRFEEVDGAPDGGTWKDDKGVEHPS